MVAPEPRGLPQRRRPRGRIGRARPLLVPLIGEEAFRLCARADRYLRILTLCLMVGLAAIISAAFTADRVRPWLVGIWVLCCLYAFFGVPLVVVWAHRSDRLVSRELSRRLGYPLRVRGGRARLELRVWKLRIDQALARSRRAPRSSAPSH